MATATFSRERGAILAGPNGGTIIAESVAESHDQYKFQRRYNQPFMYAPITGWYTFGNETGLERAQNNFLSGEDDSLFVNRLVDLVNGSATKGGNVLLTINPAAQKAAFNGLRDLGPDVAGRGRRDRAEQREDPGDGVAAELRPEQARRPRLQEGQRLRRRSCRG